MAGIDWEKIAMANDPQQKRLYEWETGWLDWNRTTLRMPALRKIVARACRKYGVKPPAVRAHRGKMWSTYDPLKRSVTFERSQRNHAVALHEAAHHILYVLTDEAEIDEFEDHGSEFLGVYLWLLNEFKIAPRIALETSARAEGLRFLRAEAASPMRFRRRVLREDA